jgi:hypothetical protein
MYFALTHTLKVGHQTGGRKAFLVKASLKKREGYTKTARR